MYVLRIPSNRSYTTMDGRLRLPLVMMVLPSESRSCPVGYNDFYNLVILTLWWLPNKVLRYIHKKDFPFFSRFMRICIKSLEKSKKMVFFSKTQYKVSKNAEFSR
jgi:hypothetical protein